MSLVERVKIEVEVEVNVKHLAERFAALTDDAQAQFFCFAAASLGSRVADSQAYYIGKHLVRCQCSTKGGRDFVSEIARAMNDASKETP